MRGGQAQQQGDEVLCAGSAAVQVVQLAEWAELSQWGRTGLGLIDKLCVGAWCGAGAPVQGACQGGVAAALPVGGDAVARLQVAHAGQVAAQVGGDGVFGGQGAQPGATLLICMRLAHYLEIGLDALAGFGVDVPAFANHLAVVDLRLSKVTASKGMHRRNISNLSKVVSFIGVKTWSALDVPAY